MSKFSNSNLEKPKPTDFDKFLPWACKASGVETDVTIVRAAQKVFQSHAEITLSNKLSKKLSERQKPVKEPSLVSSVSVSGDMHSSVFDKTESSNTNKIIIETVYNSDGDLVQLKFLKNKLIPGKIMQIIALAIPFHKYLISININSGLVMESLYEISKFLPNSEITELCFDGTCLSHANYHILLTHAKLKHLSLARCSINDDVLKTIAEQLIHPCPAAIVLSTLNLSTNRITDIGAKYLADVLRSNRQLSYLNLAGNMITDEGGVSILDTLQKFSLQPLELIESRARYVVYLEQKSALTNTLFKKLQTAAFDKSANKKKVLKKRVESQHFYRSETEIDVQVKQEKAEYLAETRMGPFNDPFSSKNTETQDGAVYCLGNNTLCCLNFAYNNLTYISLKKLHDVLVAQKYYNRIPIGLVRVVIEGNLMPVDCVEFKVIEHLLSSVINSFKMPSEPTTKKKLGK